MASLAHLFLLLECVLLAKSVSVRECCPPRNCPLGKFCRIGENCTADTSSCVVVCPTDSNHMVRGNWTSGNCEIGEFSYIIYT